MPKLDILITNKDSNASTAKKSENKPGNVATAATRDSAVKQALTSVYAQRLLTTTSNSAKTLLKFATTQYGDFTGDYIGQRKIDNAVSIAEGLTSFGSSVAMGAMAGGWIGAMVSVAAYAINTTVSQFQTSYSYSKGITRSNVIANYNSQRLGNILINGNRG